MARTFDGSDDAIEVSISTQMNVAFGTFMAVVRRTLDNGLNQNVLRQIDNNTNRSGFFLSTTASFEVGYTNGTAAASSTACTVPLDTWALIAAGKATGTVAPRLHRYRYDDNTWQHADGASTLANGTAPGTAANDRVKIGGRRTDQFFGGQIAWAAMFDRNLTDAEVESCAFSLQNVLALAPVGLWLLDQAVTTMPVENMVGGTTNNGHQSGIVGTAVATVHPPIFNRTDGGVLVTRNAAGGTTAYIDAQLRFRLLGQTWRDAQARFRLEVQQWRDAAARFSLLGLSYRDTQVRFRLVSQAWRDAQARFQLAVRAYQDAQFRLRLWGRTYLDAQTRFRFVAQAYRDSQARFRLTVQAFLDTQARFRLAAQAYQDTQLRFRLWGQSYFDAAGRFVVSVANESFRDAQARFRLLGQTWRDAQGRFRFTVQQWRDAQFRFRIWGQTWLFAQVRFVLQVQAWLDAQVRFRLVGQTWNFAQARLHLEVRSFRDVAFRFRIVGAAWTFAQARFRLLGQSWAFVQARFALLVASYRDIQFRFRLVGQTWSMAQARFRLLTDLTFKDAAFRFVLVAPESYMRDVYSTQMVGGTQGRTMSAVTMRR